MEDCVCDSPSSLEISTVVVSCLFVLSELLPVTTKERVDGFLHGLLKIGIAYKLVPRSVLVREEIRSDQDIDGDGVVGV